MPNCEQHHAPQNFICLQQTCLNNRLACQECVQLYHYHHDIHFISKAIKPLLYLNINSKKKQANMYRHELQKLKASAYQQIRELDYLCGEIREWRNNLESILIQNIQIIGDTFASQQIDCAWNTLASNSILNGSLQRQLDKKLKDNKIQKIVKSIKFLKNLQSEKKQYYQEPPKLLKHIHLVTKLVSKNLQQFKKNIGEEFMRLKGRVEQYKLGGNINLDEEQMRDIQRANIRNINERRDSWQKNNKGRKIDQQQMDKLNSEELQLKKEEEQYSVKYSEPQQKIMRKSYSNSKFKEQSTLNNSSMHTTSKSNNSQHNISNTILKRKTIENKCIQYKQNKLCIYPKEKITQLSLTSQFIRQLLMQATTYHQKDQIEQLYIYGQNQFDVQCLEMCTQMFANLKKLSYIPEIQVNPIELQMSQVFFEHVTKVRDTSLPVNPHIFTLYSKFYYLENIYIGDICKFDENIQLSNKHLKYLTLGNFIQIQRQSIPHKLIQTLSFKVSTLLTLNLFNLQTIPEMFIRLIASKNLSLRQLWISQCKSVHSSNFLDLEFTKLQILIGDCLEICSDINLPKTISSVFLDNCEIMKNIIGLSNCLKIKHFSVLETRFKLPIIQILLTEILTNSKSSLEYLNLGSQSKVTDEILTTKIILFSNLKYLCISKAKIRMSKLIQAKWANPTKLQKLDVIFEAISVSQKNLAEIGGIFSELKTLCCPYKKSYTVETFRMYKKLSNIGIQLSTRAKNTEEFENFQAEMISRGIKVNIIEKNSINE